MTRRREIAINWLQNNWYKIIAVAILLGALGHYPYAYYQITRWVVCVAALYSAYLYYQSGQKFTSLIMACVGVLFNPITPFFLARSTWQVFDAIAAMIFAIALFWPRKAANTEPI